MSDLLSAATSSVWFGILLTIGAFQLGRWINRKTGIRLLIPLLTSILMIIAVLLVFDIDYETYNQGAALFGKLLGPATVCLAVPLYRQSRILKENLLTVVVSVTCGAVAAVAGICVMCLLFGLDGTVYRSIMTKSVTSAISYVLTEEMGGHIELIVLAVTTTGITGATFSVLACRLFGIKDRIAVGLAMGTSAHAIGTSRALEVGELEGAMGSIAIVIAGLVTVILAPYAAMWIL